MPLDPNTIMGDLIAAVRPIIERHTAVAAADLAALRAEYDAHMATHAAPWILDREVDLTRNDGWTSTSGVTNSAGYNRLSQATFGADGVTITAERATTGVIYTADLMLRGYALPEYHRVEAVVQVTGSGPGVWPALWERPVDDEGPDEGEIDLWEQFGHRDEGMAVHRTPYPSRSVGIKFPPDRFPASSYDEERRLVFEKLPGAMSLWVNGFKVGTLTPPMLDAVAGAGAWATMYESGQRFYPRFTMQAGIGSKAGAPSYHGALPSTWRRSTVRLSSLKVYRPA